MKNLLSLLFISVSIFLTSCYGNPEQESDEISSEIKTDSTLIPQDSTRRDHTQTIESDTVQGKSGRVNGM
jgi:hypothetical protein